MKRLLVLTIVLLVAVSLHSFMMWRRAEDATELAARAVSISERMNKTNAILFATATNCTHTLSDVTLGAQTRVAALMNSPKPRQRKPTKVALNAPPSVRE